MKEFSLLDLTNKVNINRAEKIKVIAIFTVFVVLPAGLFGLIPIELIRLFGFIDGRALVLLVSIIFLVFQFKRVFTKSIYEAEKYFKVLTIFVILYLLYTIIIFQSSFIDALKVFRYSFHLPISILGLILYFKNKNITTIKYFLQLFYYYAIINLFLYFIIVIGFPDFINRINTNTFVESSNEKYINYLYPKFNSILLFFSYYSLLAKRQKFSALITILIIIADLNMGSRAILMLDLISMVFITFYFLKSSFINTIFKILLVFIGFGILLLFLDTGNLFVNSINKVDRITTGLKYGDLDTYGFRISLIEQAIQRAEKDGSLFWGRGYVRSNEFGEYDIAMGGDSSVASIIITEGLLGVFLRLLFLFYINKDKRILTTPPNIENKLIVLFISFFTVFTFINIVQTSLIKDYLGVPLIMVLLVIYGKQKLVKS